MASQYDPLHTAPSAPAINAKRIKVNDTFAQAADLRAEAQRSFMLDGRSVWADGRVSGSKSKLYRCSGANFDTKANSDLRKVTNGCPALVRACKQSITGEWKVTVANYYHENCAGGMKRHGMRALLPEATAIVKNSSTITAPALGNTLKATTGCGDLSGRSLNRLRQIIRNGGDQQESETYMRLADYLEQLKVASGGTITDCQVICSDAPELVHSW